MKDGTGRIIITMIAIKAMANKTVGWNKALTLMGDPSGQAARR
jgi:hypothetical protein